MESSELLQRAQDRLEELATERSTLDARRDEINKESEDLRSKISTLREMLGTFDPDEPAPTLDAPTDGAESWADLKLVDAVQRAIASSHVPLGPSAIQATLRRHGREVEGPNISATLDYLKRKEMVNKVGRGQWSSRKMLQSTVVPALSYDPMADIFSGGAHPELGDAPG